MTAFSERGYAAARVDDIARAAGTSHGTFYLYFANKHAVLVALVDRLGGELVALADALADHDGEVDAATLRSWLGEVVRVYQAHWPVVCACVSGAGDEEVAELTQLVRERFALSVARRIAVAKPQVDPMTAGRALLTLVERFVYDAVRRSEVPSEQELSTLAMVLHSGFFEPAAG